MAENKPGLGPNLAGTVGPNLNGHPVLEKFVYRTDGRYELLNPKLAEQTSRSLVQISLNDGTTLEFIANVSPSIASHLTKKMREDGFLTLWNDVDTLSVRADQVRMFTLREITK